MKFTAILVIALCLSLVQADVYLHFMKGSNGRNRERNANRNNAQRMCNTQNNAAGGYPYCGNANSNEIDGLELYAGSTIRLEWTAQHSCGRDANAFCSIILQYGCDSTFGGSGSITDGIPSGDSVTNDANEGLDYLRKEFLSVGQNQDGTNTIPIPSSLPGANGPTFGASTRLQDEEEVYLRFYAGETIDGYVPQEFGRHESFEYYRDQCLYTSRNYGLYLADQTLNGRQARRTRQSPGGTRYAFECSEERDYYPWWQPSPWVDIAVLVSDEGWCEYYQAESFNVKERYQCIMSEEERLNQDGNVIPIFYDECFAGGGQWQRIAPHGVDAPECFEHPFSRDNHLGNVNNENGQPETAHYDWTIPEELAGESCVFRIRYNISTLDYPAVNIYNVDYSEEEHGLAFDWKYNCETISVTGDPSDPDAVGTIDRDENTQCSDVLTSTSRPLFNRPAIRVFDPSDPLLDIAFNTNQIGRTFQDRSYVFRVLQRPDNVGSATIWNLGYRGCRGNIVQCYPSVEYDFVPSNLVITEDDYVHIQFCGSDFTQNRAPNNAEGWRYSDRTNMVQTSHNQLNFPISSGEMNMFPYDVARSLAYGGIDLENTECLPYQDLEDDDNSIEACGKLNPAPARYDAGLHQFDEGFYNYISTRNNNFSNRRQMGSIEVLPGVEVQQGLSTGAIVGITLGTIAGAILIVAGGFYVYKNGLPSFGSRGETVRV